MQLINYIYHVSKCRLTERDKYVDPSTQMSKRFATANI